MSVEPATGGFAALGTTITVAVADPGSLSTAMALVRDDVERLDRGASRFRDDSELAALNRSDGRPVETSDTLFVALSEAVAAAEQTSGLIDPTVGEALERCGYDRDFASIPPSGPPVLHFQRVPGWKGIHLDRFRRTASVPAGVRMTSVRRQRPGAPTDRRGPWPWRPDVVCSSTWAATSPSPAHLPRAAGRSGWPIATMPRRLTPA